MGCKTFVEKKLNDLNQITNVKVDLENQEAIINMKKNIELEVLQKKNNFKIYYLEKSRYFN